MSAGVGAIEITLLTELWWGLLLKSYVRTRGWTKEQAKKHDIAGWVRNCPDGTVEAHLEGEEAAGALVVDGRQRFPQRRRPRRSSPARLVLAAQQQGSHGAGGAGDQCQRAERRPSLRRVAPAVEDEPGGERRAGGGQRAEGRAPPEVPAPDRAGDQVAHPRGPGVVARDAQRRIGGCASEEDGLLHARIQLKERQAGERQHALPREPDGPERGPPASEAMGEPGGRQVDELC